MSAGRPERGTRGEPPAKQGPTCELQGHGKTDAPAASHGGHAGDPPGPGGSTSPSADWHARLGPLDFSVGIRHFELRGVFPEQPPAPPDAAAADDLPDRESEGGAGG